jgi:hypothetical protein
MILANDENIDATNDAMIITIAQYNDDDDEGVKDDDLFDFGEYL